MQVEDILTPERCRCRMSGFSKKQTISRISQVLAADGEKLDPDSIFDAMMERERLGSTGLGSGIAIPHCRVPLCTEILGALITLQEPVDFDAMDRKPVDLLFALIVPQQQADEHIQVLAMLVKLLGNEALCSALRESANHDELYHRITRHRSDDDVRASSG